MIRRPPRSTQSRSSAASDVYKRQGLLTSTFSDSGWGSYGLGAGVERCDLCGIVHVRGFDNGIAASWDFSGSLPGPAGDHGPGFKCSCAIPCPAPSWPHLLVGERRSPPLPEGRVVLRPQHAGQGIEWSMLAKAWARADPQLRYAECGETYPLV